MSTITLQTIAVRSQACIKFSHQAVASLLILNILWKNVLKKNKTAQNILVSASLFHALTGFAMWIVNACSKFKLLLWSFVTRAVYANKKKKNQSLQWHRMCIGGYCTVALLTVSCTKKKKGGELFTQCKALINVHAVCSSALSWYTDGKQNEKKKKFALSKKCVCSCVSLRTQSPVLSVGCCGKVGGKQGLPVTCLRICGFVVRTLGALDLKGILNKTTP